MSSKTRHKRTQYASQSQRRPRTTGGISLGTVGTLGLSRSQPSLTADSTVDAAGGARSDVPGAAGARRLPGERQTQQGRQGQGGQGRAPKGQSPRQSSRPVRSSRYRHVRRRGQSSLKIAVIVGVAVLALGIIFVVYHKSGSTGQAGQYVYAVGNPGPGAQAPAIRLPSTAGRTFDLVTQRGKTILLYFQEGLTCEPCWTQLQDIDAQLSSFRGLGIDKVVSITTDPLDALVQKVHDEGIASPVLSDSQLTVSTVYNANQYGMMGAGRDGHTFILVGPDGRIRWRADYGGSPNYTMYVPIPNLLADLQKGMQQSGVLNPHQRDARAAQQEAVVISAVTANMPEHDPE